MPHKNPKQTVSTTARNNAGNSLPTNDRNKYPSKHRNNVRNQLATYLLPLEPRDDDPCNHQSPGVTEYPSENLTDNFRKPVL